MNDTPQSEPQNDPSVKTNADAIPSTLPPPPGRSATHRPLKWLRHLFAANPFFLASAVALLYGIYRITSDTGVLDQESHQLIFNFTALQVYEMALVALAIFLARRSIWYDSTLLVLIENLVLIVPFILVTQASLIDQSWLWGFSLLGVGLLLARVGALKQFMVTLNLPWRLLILGSVVLGVNVLLPTVYRELAEDRVARTITWGPAYYTNELSWLILLPLLIFGANLLPAARPTGPLWPQRRWLPLALFSSWILASGVHLYALSYVYTFALRSALWAPVLLAVTWTLRHQVLALIDKPPAWLKVTILALPLPIPLMAVASGDAWVALATLTINTVIYGRISMSGSHRSAALQFGLVSAVGMINSLPWVLDRYATTPALDEILALTGVVETLIGYTFMAGLLSRRPIMGVLGAVASALFLVWTFPFVHTIYQSGVQGFMVFLMLHSLRWDNDATERLTLFRWLTAVTWSVHSIIWAFTNAPAWPLAVVGGGVVAVWTLAWRLEPVRPSFAVLVSGWITMTCRPVLDSLAWAGDAPRGSLAILVSFLLLGAGTLLALSRHRWENHGTEGSSSQSN